MLLLPGTEPAGARRVAGSLRQRIAATAFPDEASTASPALTVSAGVAALRPAPGGDPGLLVQEADRALYLAKERGRDRVVAAFA